MTDLDAQWMASKRLNGVAFSLNDSVAITAGSHRGEAGAVISLVGLEPEPTYLVELANGSGDVTMTQSDLLPSMPASTGNDLAKLLRWYASQCDEDWEHQHGIEIGTLDNPGWTVRVDLSDTPLADRAFAEVRNIADPVSWIDCRVVEKQFLGHGGPLMLAEIIGVFVRWMES